MKLEEALAEALQSAPTRKLRATLVRRVPLSPLIESGTVDSIGSSQVERVRGRERGDLPGLRAAAGFRAHPWPHPEAVAEMADLNKTPAGTSSTTTTTRHSWPSPTANASENASNS